MIGRRRFCPLMALTVGIVLLKLLERARERERERESERTSKEQYTLIHSKRETPQHQINYIPMYVQLLRSLSCGVVKVVDIIHLLVLYTLIHMYTHYYNLIYSAFPCKHNVV